MTKCTFIPDKSFTVATDSIIILAAIWGGKFKAPVPSAGKAIDAMFFCLHSSKHLFIDSLRT